MDLGTTNTLVGPESAADPTLRDRYIARLLTKFPAQLSACYLVHSVNEATELALRLARTHRPGKDVIVLEDTDYGMTTSLASMSPARRKFWVHTASRRDALDVAAKVQAIQARGRGLGAFFADGIFDAGYLNDAYASVSAAGGLNIALEMQTGMGRVGEAFWEFARHNVIPDIVVIGESMGNGFPMAAVVTRPDLAAPFDTGTGGGPLACAAGLAVLDALQPPTWSPDFSEFKARGAGLCWEIDVTDARTTVARLGERGVFIPSRGNTLLFRPPLTFSKEDATSFIHALRLVLY